MASYPDLTIDDVYDAFSCADFSPNIPFEEWAQIGRALYAGFGNEGLDAFQYWSESGSSYKESEFNSWCRNFKQVKRTGIGSFIRAALNAGWKPEKREYTEEEKKAWAIEQQKRKQESHDKQQKIIELQWKSLKAEQQLFHSLPKIDCQKNIGKYLSNKMLHNAYLVTDLRRYENEQITIEETGYSFLTSSTVRPLWSELGNKGKFCGFEKLADKKGKKSGNQKFASGNAMTELGFTSIGYTEDTRRIFIGGGYANCVTAHLETGECWLSPVGEGQIPDLIKRLRAQHPDIRFIAAPDNDREGLRVSKDSNGPYTVPAQDGADWWDVWHNEGRQALIDQINNIRGFEVIVSNSRYLSAEIKPGLNLLESDMGTGKSFCVRKHIEKNPSKKTLIISHRQQLAKSFKNAFEKDENGKTLVDVHYYEDLTTKGGGDQGVFLREAQCLVISVDSLYKINGSQWDFVFVDEIQQNLSHYFAETNVHGEQNLNMLHFFLRHSDYQVLADAHLGELTINFCAQLGLNSGIHYRNDFKIGLGKTINIFESKTHLSEFAKQEIFQGKKSYVFSNSKREIKTLAIELEQAREQGHFSGKTLVVHADSKDNPDVKEALTNIERCMPKLDVMLASPTLGTGFDISAKNHNFDSVVGFLNSRVGSSEEGHQGLNRARDITTLNVYLDPALSNDSTDAQFIYDKIIEERSSETIKILNIDPETGCFTSRNPLYEWLYCEVKALLNKSKNDYKGRFIALAEKSGYTINFIAKSSIDAMYGKDSRKIASERTDRMQLRDIQNAKCLTGDDLDAMNRNSEGVSSEVVTKSRVAYDLNIFDATDDELDDLYVLAKDTYREFLKPGENARFNSQDDAPITLPATDLELIINALTFKQTKSRFVNSIKRLSLVSLDAETARRLDVREISQESRSRVTWRHQSTKRKHLIKILAAAGVNEQLCYSGKTWDQITVQEKLINWLKNPKTQDSLCKYSGVTVTNNTLKNPVQWFNSFLRNAGIPVVKRNKRLVAGKHINVYGIDQDELDTVRTLVSVRTRGIERGMAEREDDREGNINRTMLMQEVTEFLTDITEGVDNEAHHGRFKRLMDRVTVLRNSEKVKEHLVNAYAKIAHKISADSILKTDPPLATVISNQIGQGGSPAIGDNPNDYGLLSLNRGEEIYPDFLLSQDQLTTKNREEEKVRSCPFVSLENEVEQFLRQIKQNGQRELLKPIFDSLINRVIILSGSREIKKMLTTEWQNFSREV